MTKLGDSVPPNVARIRRYITQYLREKRIEPIDANSEITGKDFLQKIWQMIVSVPLGVGIVTSELPGATTANIFYEVGLLQALGRETLIVKGDDAIVPSDFVRTEYIEYSPKGFKEKFMKYLDKYFSQADHFEYIADQVVANPLLAIDYLRRGYLISGEERIRRRATEVFESNRFDSHSAEAIQAFLDG